MSDRLISPEVSTGPWVGPVPYEERHWRYFFGRDTELNDMLRRLDSGRLLILTSPSGVGKTSFLRAALVPSLRRQRAQSLSSRRGSQRGLPDPAVLVVRDWPSPRNKSPDECIRAGITASLERYREAEAAYPDSRDRVLRTKIRSDFLTLLPALTEQTAIRQIRRFAELAGGALLILDQFEEVLQWPAAARDYALDLVARIHGEIQQASVLLSFRYEFEGRLGALERHLGGLDNRTVRLAEIHDDALKQAIQKSAARDDIEVSGDAASLLVEWVLASSHLQSTSTRINLLSLQAVLREVQGLVPRSGGGAKAGTRQVSTQTLVHLLNTHAERNGGVPTATSETEPGELVRLGAPLVESALVRYLDTDVLRLPEGLVADGGLPRGRSLLPAEERLVQIRRCAARMAPLFSTTADLKAPVFVRVAAADAWVYDWRVLGTDSDTIQKALGEVPLSPWSTEIIRDTLVRAGVSEERTTSRLVFSGPSRRRAEGETQGRSPLDEVLSLLDVARETLEVLWKRGNVLRPKDTLDGMTYELVHDGFARPFRTWAVGERRSPLDTLLATTAQRGADCEWDALSGPVRDACWIGCWVGPPGPDKRLTMDQVSFTDCDLTGTYFESCDFVGGGFFASVLDGVVFHNCTFSRGQGNAEPVQFAGSHMTGVSFFDSTLAGVAFCPTNGNDVRHGGIPTRVTAPRAEVRKLELTRVTLAGDTLAAIEFRDCVVTHLVVDGATVGGGIAADNCWFVQCDLADLAPAAARITLTESRFFHCRFDDDGSGTLLRRLTGAKPENRFYPAAEGAATIDPTAVPQYVWREQQDGNGDVPDGNEEHARTAPP